MLRLERKVWRSWGLWDSKDEKGDKAIQLVQEQPYETSGKLPPHRMATIPRSACAESDQGLHFK